MLFISSFALTEQESTSAAKTSSKPDKRQSCVTPLFKSNEFEAKPLLNVLQ